MPSGLDTTGISEVYSALLQKMIGNPLAYPVLFVKLASLMTLLVQ